MSLAEADTGDALQASTADMAAIFQRQRAAHLSAGAPSLAERRQNLDKLLAIVVGKRVAIGQAISADFGNRSWHETLLAEIVATRNSIKHTRRNLGGWMRQRRVAVSLDLLPGRARVIYQPLGVVGIISPWNYPFQLAMAPLAAALAAGNRVMLKPSEITPRTTALLASLLGEAFPPEVVSVITGGPSVGADFAKLPFDHLLYTGSTGIGRRVMQAAADNLTPVTLELGGKSPVIVAADADMAEAAQKIMFGKLVNCGQTCIAPDYVLVPADKRDEFLGHAEAAARKMYPTIAANPDYTAIVSDKHYARLKGYLAEASAGGALLREVNPAGEALPAAGRKIAPTFVVEPDDRLKVMTEEIFGPLLPVKSYGALDDAIAYVNSRPRPLALYFFGNDSQARDRVLARTTSGGVSVNETLLHFLVEDLPFGGIGPSGMGSYHGFAGFETFSHRKGVFLQSRLNATWMLRPPFRGLATTLLNVLLRK
jgi:coniferyl-aldehyde dehydrogenase